MAAGGGKEGKRGEFGEKGVCFGNCLVLRMTIHDDDLEVLISLAGEVAKEAWEIPRLVEGGDDDTKEWF